MGSPPQHHILTSAAVGGNAGKTTLAFMLAAYLSNSPQADTIVIIDIVSPRIGIYDSFAHIFGTGGAPHGYANLSDYLKAPRIDETSTRNLLTSGASLI